MQCNSLIRFFCAFLIWTFCSCEYEEDFPSGIGDGHIEALILNEGKYGTNMGGISILYKNGMVTPDVFRIVNNRPLGDVAQSLTYINGKYFITLNNSKKIEIVDPKTFKSEGTILYTQAGLPRHIVAVSDSTAIVSDLLSNNTAGASLPSQLVRIRTKPPYGVPLEYIVVRKWIEYMTVAENKLFGITDGGLYVFDFDDISATGARVITDVYNEEMTKTCRMLKDADENIWVLMHEYTKYKISAVLWKCINPRTEKVVKIYRLPIGHKTGAQIGDVVGASGYNRTDIDESETLIYFNVRTYVETNELRSQQSVYVLDTKTGRFYLHRHLPGVEMMYGWGVSPKGDIYICDCLDYSAQRGFIRHFKSNGNIESKKVGVYPSFVYFPDKHSAE